MSWPEVCRSWVCLGLLFCTAPAMAQPGGSGPPDRAGFPGEGLVSPPPPRPAPDRPVEVGLELILNKISDIDTVEETYRIDAYLVVTWKDPAGARFLRDGESRALLQGERVEEVLGTELWGPHLELINKVGEYRVEDTQLEIRPDGGMVKLERFQANLSSNMDFRNFPFDRQTVQVHFESFSYPETDLLFTEPVVSLGHLQEAPSPEWLLGEPHTGVGSVEYSVGDYSRASFYLDAERRPGYFVWQVFLPLLLILGTSWIVFWIREFSDRINVAFTCLLTLVAFNFYTSTLLPQLPYNTFIEVVVISAYVATFVLIGYILVAERVSTHVGEERGQRMNLRGRWWFPCGYALLLGLIVERFFH
jgi:hypothetical protein